MSAYSIPFDSRISWFNT